MDKFIIVSLKHSEKDALCFWRPDAAGYTVFPWAAGIYDKAEIERDPEYYNDGFNAIAIPLTTQALSDAGIKCTFDMATQEVSYKLRASYWCNECDATARFDREFSIREDKPVVLSSEDCRRIFSHFCERCNLLRKRLVGSDEQPS